MDTNELAQKYEVIAEDLEYGRAGDTPLLARLYRPRGATGFPAIVDVHGGAWVANDRLQNAAMDQVIAAAGTAVLALDFRMAPASPYPASIADINLGIRWLKTNIAKLGGDASRVGGLGTSSGGHQLWLNVLRPRDARYAALTLAGASDVDASLGFVVVCWPISDPVARYNMARETGNERLVKNHDAFFLTEAAMAEANPQTILESGEARKLPSALLIQGTADANVTPDMADRFVAAYTKAGGRITLRKFEGQPHTFISQNPTIPASVEALGLITDFIREQTR
ncbi:MAG TPA: alpha/beta hydrolase [Bradyrhizobium sp.]|jgi:acetyl esterase|nr:alpha/beta hydrolase [Bradyrhizobium sp.]